MWLVTSPDWLWMKPHMWCDLAGSVRICTCAIFSFLFDWKAHLERYIMLKTPLQSSGSKVMILRTIENNIYSFLFLVIYLTISVPDFRLIPLDRNTYIENQPSPCDCVPTFLKVTNLPHQISTNHYAMHSTELLYSKIFTLPVCT